MKPLILMLILAFYAYGQHDKDLVEKSQKSVGLLYSQSPTGEFQMLCTATAFEKTRNGYLFISAAHCIGNDDYRRERSATGKDIPFYITFDEVNTVKKFYPAKIVFTGYQSRGEDFSVFEVLANEEWSIIPLGDESLEKEGSSFINISSPLGLGKQVLYGTISSLYLDRPLIFGDINWKGTIVLQIAGVDGGCSGSVIISESQKAIIGFLVGSVGNTIVAIPVSKFKLVRKAVETGKYKWYQPDYEINPDGSIRK